MLEYDIEEFVHPLSTPVHIVAIQDDADVGAVQCIRETHWGKQSG